MRQRLREPKNALLCYSWTVGDVDDRHDNNVVELHGDYPHAGYLVNGTRFNSGFPAPQAAN